MGKTVTTYLINGDPNGIQYSFISNKICQMFIIPRSNLEYLKEQEKLQKPAFYVLVGEDEISSRLAYIGETENFRERVKDHENKKQFWQKAYVFVSKDEDMTKADVQYLEYKAIHEAVSAKNYILKDNKQIPKEPNLPEYQKDSMNEFFNDIKFLISFSGCNLFDVVQEVKEEHLFKLKSSNCCASGYYGSSGMIVLKNSIISSDVTPSFSNKKFREDLIKEITTTNDDGKLILTINKTFSSPSQASSFCLGRSSNGWTEWKDDDGYTLDDIYRNTLN